MSRPSVAARALQSAFAELDQSHWAGDDLIRSEARARLAAENGQTDIAKTLVNSINTRLPNLSGMWELQGELNEREGNRKEAILDFRRAIFLDDTDALPHTRLAQLELALSDTRDAAREAQEIG